MRSLLLLLGIAFTLFHTGTAQAGACTFTTNVSFLQGCVEWGLFLDRAPPGGTACPVCDVTVRWKRALRGQALRRR